MRLDKYNKYMPPPAKDPYQHLLQRQKVRYIILDLKRSAEHATKQKRNDVVDASYFRDVLILAGARFAHA